MSRRSPRFVGPEGVFRLAGGRHDTDPLERLSSRDEMFPAERRPRVQVAADGEVDALQVLAALVAGGLPDCLDQHAGVYYAPRPRPAAAHPSLPVGWRAACGAVVHGVPREGSRPAGKLAVAV